jgi:hypothetical protein
VESRGTLRPHFPRSVKVDSHIPCCSHAVPLPCRSDKALDCVSHLIYIVRPRLIHACHAVPLPCHEYAVLKATSQGHGGFMAWWRRQGDGMLTACSRLASLGPLLLPRPVPGSLLSEAYESQIAVAKWPVKQSGVCDRREEAYYFCART